jgi:outer membrane biosynthesis protein TonB
MVVWSAVFHAGALGLVLVSPSLGEREPPRVIAVELISPAPPAAAPAAAPKPAPAPAPAPPPEAVPAPPPPPPPPEPKAIVLPEKQTAPKPKEKPKEKPKPQKEVFKEPPKKQEKSLDDLLAEMRGSEAKTAPAPAPGPPAEAPVNTATGTIGAPSEGVGEISPEEAAWRARVRQKMKGIWIVPPGFRTQPLQTLVVVSLDNAGNILGDPRIKKKSGNPWYDEGVMRGLAKASPLPAPPQAGDWVLQFEPGDSL